MTKETLTKPTSGVVSWSLINEVTLETDWQFYTVCRDANAAYRIAKAKNRMHGSADHGYEAVLIMDGGLVPYSN